MSSAGEHRRHNRRAKGPDPISNDRRAARREHLLGPDAACALCGERTPEMLIRVSRSALEEHHVAGRAIDPDLTAVLCRNCHACVTEGQRRLGVDLRRETQRALLELIEAALMSLAALDRARADAEQKQATKLRALVAKLDRDCPGWRDWPEAQA